jgi:UDP-N-acetylglucosamine acyltransferase
METALFPRTHPTAVISPEAELADDVQIGPYAVIEGEVRVGPGCVLRPHVHLSGPLRLGRDNVVFTGAVLGGRPQHLKYEDEPTSLYIGDDNVFREHVTVHRGTADTGKTQIGSRNFFMAGSHIAHDCRIGNDCTLANGALVGGHCVIEDGVYLSGNCAVHQFMRIGRLALLRSCSIATKDIPPFVVQRGINSVVGINAVGMRRGGMTNDEIDAVRRAFHILYRQGQTVPSALNQLGQEMGTVGAVAEMITFIGESTRGISLAQERHRYLAAQRKARSTAKRSKATISFVAAGRPNTLANGFGSRHG